MRSCYETDFQFFTDDPTPTRVRYYFTDKPCLPFPHRFGSSNWLGEGQSNGLGEVEGATRKWVNGQRIGSAPGGSYCGTIQQWQEGSPLPPDPPIAVQPDGTPKCCFGPLTVHYGEGGQRQGFNPSVVGGTGGQRQGGRGVFQPLLAGGGQSQGGQGAFAVLSDGGQVQGGDGLFAWSGEGGQVQGGDGEFAEVSTGLQAQGGTSGVWFWPSSGGQRQGGAGSFEEVPVTGSILLYALTGPPTGYLKCDGAAVSRTTYAALFAVIGTTYGVGDGSTTFNVPDLRGRVPLGVGTGSGLTARSIAQTGGFEKWPLVTAELPAHTHPQQSSTYLASGGSLPSPSVAGIGASGGTTGSAGSGTSHENMQPWLCMGFCIAT